MLWPRAIDECLVQGIWLASLANTDISSLVFRRSGIHAENQL